ncbi:uncharacterized protein LOC125859010 [Solanum stenotomum]|uniref:uncharacterized protein LOC125859010 n=1 Tax=Solanum stenotomum TaxID=172797 RepID=UPI0020D15ACE|nr:uncharacterized protein LOC125859010 [Solanum stenotomum]
MTNEDIRAAFLTLAQAMTAQANRDVEPRVNTNENTAASRLRDIVRVNPPTFLGSRIGQYPRRFLDKIYKILDAMGVSSREKGELASYHFKEVDQIWFVTGVSHLVKEGCRTERLHGDMILSRLVVYSQPIKESKMTRVNHKGGGASQIAKSTWSTCGKKHFGNCLSGTTGCCGCGKNYHKVRDCPNIVAKGRNARQSPYSGLSVAGQERNRFYDLQANKEANLDEGFGKS